jgi:hypothetical protein
VKFNKNIQLNAKDITNKFKLFTRKGFENSHTILNIRNMSNLEIIIRYEKPKEIIFLIKPFNEFYFDVNLNNKIGKYFKAGTRIKIKYINGNNNLVPSGKVTVISLDRLDK